MAKFRRLAETLHAVALGTWFGCLVATAAAAAILFPAIRDLDPTLASHAAYDGPHWLIVAGTPANTIFWFSDAVQFACCLGALGSLIVVLVALGSGWRRWDIGLRTVFMSVAVTMLAYRLLIQAPEMATHLSAYWESALAGDNATAAAERAAFDALHRPASNVLVGTALAVLGSLVLGVWSAQSPPGSAVGPELQTPKLAQGEPAGMATQTPQNPRGLKDIPFALPVVEAAEKRRARRLLAALDEHYPEAHCALRYATPHELLIATILSAQCTDAAVNKATPALFERFPMPAGYAASSPEEIEPFVHSLGFFRQKSKSIHSSMTDILAKHGGAVPRTMDELLELRGVARKTANVVLGNAYGINVGFVVDTHVQRLATRLGLVEPGETVQRIERRLMALFPRDRWCDLSHMLIWHGRGSCTARGKACSDHAICRKFGIECERGGRG